MYDRGTFCEQCRAARQDHIDRYLCSACAVELDATPQTLIVELAAPVVAVINDLSAPWRKGLGAVILDHYAMPTARRMGNARTRRLAMTLDGRCLALTARGHNAYTVDFED